MNYALTTRLPRDQRNDIAEAIRLAIQDNRPDSLRNRPGIVFACDAERSQPYYCIYCPVGRVHLYGATRPHRYFQHYEDSCIENPCLQDGDIPYTGGNQAFCN